MVRKDVMGWQPGQLVRSGWKFALVISRRREYLRLEVKHHNFRTLLVLYDGGQLAPQ
jgi:hypothetical protein